jgi:hypothetical protein
MVVSYPFNANGCLISVIVDLYIPYLRANSWKCNYGIEGIRNTKTSIWYAVCKAGTRTSRRVTLPLPNLANVEREQRPQ